jgi:MFS family permease
MWELLRRNRRYARLWGGETVSMLGDSVTALALPMLAILVLKAPAWQVGVLTAASWTPYLVALFVGAMVDRVASKRVVLVVVDLVRALALATIPLIAFVGQLRFTHLIIVAITVGLAGVVSQTAHASFFVRVVQSSDFVTANSLNSTARSVTGIGGPPVAGWLVQALSAPIAIVVDSCSYLVSAATLAGMKVDEPRPERRRTHVFAEAAEGLRAMLGNRWLSSALWCTSLMNLANFAIIAIALVFATRTLHLSAAEIGTAQGIGAVGALIGALLTSRVSTRIGLFPVVMLGTVFFSLPFFALAATPTAAPTIVKITIFAGCIFVVTGAIVMYDITMNSVAAKVMPDDMRGRIVGAFSSINYGIRPLGALAGGAAAELWGTQITIMVAAAVGLTAVIPLLRSPLRKARVMDDVPAATPVG